MSSATSQSFAVFVGIDWADRKHDVCWRLKDETTCHHEIIDHTPEAIDEWVNLLLKRGGGQPVAVCVELSRGPLIVALMKYDFITIYPLPPARLKKYRDAVGTSSGAKSDITDADLILDFLLHHRTRLHAWQPADDVTRELAILSGHRRDLVDDRTSLTNKLRVALKSYFPQLFLLVGKNLYTELVCALLGKWPTLQALQMAKPQTIRTFYYKHGVRREDTIKTRLKTIDDAMSLTKDRVLIDTGTTIVQLLIKQIRVLNESLDNVERRLKQLTQRHEDGEFFLSLPGAGDALAPRLLVAFGSDRKRLQDASELQCLSGIAPVTKQSGKTKHVSRRWACNTFMLQTFHEYAHCSRQRSKWARAYYDMQRDRGNSHHQAVRSLAFKWIRVLFRCWKNREPYDEAKYLASLKARTSPLLAFMEPTPTCA